MKKRVLILCVKVAISAGAVAYLLSSGKLRIGQMAIGPGGWPWIAAGASMCLALMGLSQIRYWLLLSSRGVEVGLRKVIQIGFIGWFFNAALVGGLGFLSGDAVRIGYLMRESDRRAAIFGATLVDRAIGLMAIITFSVFALQVGWSGMVHSAGLHQFAVALYALFAAIGLGVLLSGISLAKGRAAAAIAWVLVGGVAAAFMARGEGSAHLPVGVMLAPLAAAMVAPSFLQGGNVHNMVVNRLWMGHRIGEFITVLLGYREKVRVLLAAFVLSLLIQTCAVFGLFFAAKGVSIEREPTLWQVWFAGPPVSALSILPLPAGGLGIGEAAFDTMLRFCAAPDGSRLAGGAAVYLSFRVLMTLMGLTGLPLFLVSQRKPVSDLYANDAGTASRDATARAATANGNHAFSSPSADGFILQSCSLQDKPDVFSDSIPSRFSELRSGSSAKGGGDE